MRLLLALIFSVSTAFAQDFYALEETGVDGKAFKMDSFKNKVVLVVNIASQCGYTGQLDDLEKLYHKYKGQGFVVLGVPTNDFGGQTPEDDKGIAEFCKKNYGVTFPLLSKKTVKGDQKRPLYQFLTEKTGKEFQGDIGWNFEKFLVDKKGAVVARMKSGVDPMDKDLVKKVESLLK